MPEPLSSVIGVSARDERDDGSETPRRCAKQKRHRGAVTQGRREGREERVERQRDNHARQRKSEPPDLPVGHGCDQAVHMSGVLGLLLVADTNVFFHALLGKAGFQRAEPSLGS